MMNEEKFKKYIKDALEKAQERDEDDAEMQRKLIRGVDRFFEAKYDGKVIMPGWKDPDDYSVNFKRVYMVEAHDSDKPSMVFVDDEKDQKTRYEYEKAIAKFINEETELFELCIDEYQSFDMEYAVYKYVVVKDNQGLLRMHFNPWND